MPRRLRIELPGGLYHVTNRGVDRMNIVRNDDDRHEWFRLLNRVATRCGWRVFAHVLMTNHFHLFLKLHDPNLSSGLHDLQSGYATLFNKTHERTGPVFQGRFHAVLVESEGHAWSLSRYIHLNPCRAMRRGRVYDFSDLAGTERDLQTKLPSRQIRKIVDPTPLAKKPEDYHWSTYRYFMDPKNAPSWLDWRTVLCEFGGTEAASRIAYRRYVESGLAQPPANPLDEAFEGVLLGSPSFIATHRHLIEEAEADIERITRSTTIQAAIAVVAEAFSVSPQNIQRRGRHDNIARETAMWLCRETVRVPLSEIATAFGNISSGTVTDSVRRCESRQAKIAEYRDECERLRGRVYDFSDLAGTTLLMQSKSRPAKSEKS